MALVQWCSGFLFSAFPASPLAINSAHNDPMLLNTLESRPKPSPNSPSMADMAVGNVSGSTTEYCFFTFPPELRIMIYHYLLKASYIGVPWYTCTKVCSLHRKAERAGHTRPEADLNILRVCRQLTYEAMCFLYRQNAFCFEVWREKRVPAKPLGTQAISMMQYVDIRVDTNMFFRSCSGSERRTRIVSQLRGLGGSHVPRKRCHITLDYLVGKHYYPSPRRLIRELSTLTSFELLILDAREFSYKSDGYNFLDSSWPWFQMYMKGLEYELGPGEFDTYEGNCCVVFHPIKERSIRNNSILPHKRKSRAIKS